DQVFLSDPKVNSTVPENSLENESSEVLIPSEAVTIEEEEIPEIAKPADLPVSEEPRQTPSVFDSVRIMDKPDGGNMPSGMGIPQNEPRPAPAGPGTSEPPTGVRAQTSSNIGLVDTDGRKGIKLKPLEEGTILNGRN